MWIFVWCPNDNDNDYVNNVSSYCITIIVFLLAYIYFVYFAAYPEIWVTVSLGLIHLYTKNYRVVRKILKPLNIIHNKAHITAITGESAIVAFATFTFLSSTDIVFAFCGLAKNTEVYSNIDHSVYKTVLFADASIEYLSQTHVIYFLVALIECIFIVFIPSMLLFIYPTRIYRGTSRILSTRKQLAITTFAEASFKDAETTEHL